MPRFDDALSIEQTYGRRAARKTWESRPDLRGRDYMYAELQEGYLHVPPLVDPEQRRRVRQEATTEWERLQSGKQSTANRYENAGIEQAHGRRAAMWVWSNRRDLRGQPFLLAFAAVFFELPSKLTQEQRERAEAAARAEWERLLANWSSP